MGARLAQIDGARASLRQLASAAEVSVPTLRHYFGSRDEIVVALFEAYRQRGDVYLQRAGIPTGGLETSIRDFLNDLAYAMRRRGLGDIVAVGLVEGLLNHRLGPAALESIIDPSLDALVTRLQAHQDRGELADVNLRNAALSLIAPIILGAHHQDQMFGASLAPLDVPALIEDLVRTFVAANTPR